VSVRALTRAWVRAFAAVVIPACALAAVGCASLLGGLDEGSARRDEPADAAAPEAAADVPGKPSSWLEGFAYRVAFAIESRETVALAGYTTAVGLETRALIAAKKMRADGADIRVTKSDGTSVVPHWIQSGLNGEATRLWAKLDLPPGTSTVYLYYGNESAPATASLRDAFVEGVIANGAFDEGTSPWTETPATNGGVSTLRIAGSRAQLALARTVGAPVASSIAWCQAVTFPPGHVYRLVFDATTLHLEVGQVEIWTGPPGGHAVWTHAVGVGRQAGIDSDRIDPGATQVCVGVTVRASPGPQAASAEFENVRVRLFAEHDPIAGPAGPEESR
jgi:hypothetical protein